jgi:hypothetical protein
MNINLIAAYGSAAIILALCALILACAKLGAQRDRSPPTVGLVFSNGKYWYRNTVNDPWRTIP